MPQIDSNIVTAVFGLIGVIVGGLITGVMSYILEKRRANREEAKEKRKRIIALKQAARLIDADFDSALGAVECCISFKRWTSGFDPIRLEVWREHQSVLATEATLDDWIRLKKAVKAMEGYQLGANYATNQGDLNTNVVALAVPKAAKGDLESGRAALKPYLDLAVD
jgi:hypothetical protein